MKVLVTGGCGYIGSHTLVDLIDNGFDVISVDNLSRSSDSVLDGIEKITGKKVTNYPIDLADIDSTKAVFQENKDIDGIIHFAAFKSVGESVKYPLLYYKNNFFSLISLLECVREFNIPQFVFSSSCSVYGNVDERHLPVTENTPLQAAESPYGNTKKVGENIITDFSKVCDANFVMLRYFNPIGAHESSLIGETPYTTPENLMPYITQTAAGIREKLTVFGDDYETRDGTCVRDYIHVMDIANAHTKAMKYLFNKKNTKNCEVFNLGSGDGTTVKEMINAFEKVNGVKINHSFGERRAGDVVQVYADNKRAKKLLNWELKYTLEDMMRTAWEWEKVIRF